MTEVTGNHSMSRGCWRLMPNRERSRDNGRRKRLSLSLSLCLPALPSFLPPSLHYFLGTVQILYMSLPISFTGPPWGAVVFSILQMRLQNIMQLISVKAGLGLHVCQTPKLPCSFLWASPCLLEVTWTTNTKWVPTIKKPQKIGHSAPLWRVSE